MRIRWQRLAILAAIATLAGCFNTPNGSSGPALGIGNVTADNSGGHTVNGTVRVPDGQKTGDLSTVNGSIDVGSDATLSGAQTVNGSISLGSHTAADSLTTVNGSISLQDDARVAHTVRAVNGQLTLHNGADVGGSLINVNGAINLNAAHVGGGITTSNGDITIEGASHVEGGILVQKPPEGWFQIKHEPRIVIGPGSVVTGNLRFERAVELYVSDKAKIGPVSGTTPLRYPGEGPVG